MKISKILYGTGMVVGVGLMFADHQLWGLGVMFLGLFLSMFVDPELQPSSSSYSKPEKKPYYKNEFEEYQHYKHCKRHLK